MASCGMEYVLRFPIHKYNCIECSTSANDVMTFVNLIYLGIITDRIPVLAPFTPSHINMGAKNPVPPIDFGDVFDVPRLAKLLNWPVLEWRDIKDEQSNEWDGLGCWNVWEAVQDEEHHPRGSIAPEVLGLDLSYTHMPKDIKLLAPEIHDFHTTFWNLAKFAYPDTRASRIGETKTSEVLGLTLPPDEDMLCFDYLYYVCASTVSSGLFFRYDFSSYLFYPTAAVRMGSRIHAGLEERRAVHALDTFTSRSSGLFRS